MDCHFHDVDEEEKTQEMIGGDAGTNTASLTCSSETKNKYVHHDLEPIPYLFDEVQGKREKNYKHDLKQNQSMHPVSLAEMRSFFAPCSFSSSDDEENIREDKLQTHDISSGIGNYNHNRTHIGEINKEEENVANSKSMCALNYRNRFTGNNKSQPTRRNDICKSSIFEGVANNISKPKRNLSAYNYFFKYERIRILQLFPSGYHSTLPEYDYPLKCREKYDGSRQKCINENWLYNDLLQIRSCDCIASFPMKIFHAKQIAISEDDVANNKGNKKKRRGRPPGSKYKGPRPPAHKKITFTELGKIIGKAWQSLDPAIKIHYVRLAKQDKERYQKEMKAYGATIGRKQCSILM